VPSVSASLLVLVGVVLVTAYLRGGIGIRSLGSSQYGGKGYFYIMGAVAGYFALISKRLPKEKAGLFVGLFFLAALTALVPNLAYFGGPKFMFLFYLFPPSYAYEQALGDYALDRDFARVYGLTFASNGVYCYLLARYGLRGVFDVTRPHRLALLLAAAAGSLFCGFRSFMLLFILTVITQFFAEKLFRPKVILGVGASFLVVCSAVLPNADRLPLVAQRSISFLPPTLVSINPAIRQNARLSTDWRLHMWRDVLPDVPSYLIKGKGYGLDPGELALAVEADRRGYTTYQWALVTGAYHNGALTLLIPFGIGGVVAFLWFAVASIKYLYRKYRYGEPALKTVNTFLLAYFVAKLIYYFGVFGSFYTDFFVFTGIIGLSISLNGPDSEQVQAAPVTATVPQLATQER